VAVIFFLQLNQGSSEPPTTVAGNIVRYTANGFEPGNIRITVGQAVVWRNESAGDITVDSNPHPIHTSYRPLNLGTIGAGAEKQLTFTETGTYNYHNHLNSTKQGTVTVE
ncbi:MAG: cupredoxin domain-containing protein, partial [Candidatus Kerfeldbacteria bacterium]|nr:cupredoxin domain-containing protein [Candidatus Kerfeldbacteria bacterium]